MAVGKPTWTKDVPKRVASGHSEVEWQMGRPYSARITYQVTVVMPNTLTTDVQRGDWYRTNIEGAKFTDSVGLLHGIPEPETPHPQFGGDGNDLMRLVVYNHRITSKGYAGGCSGTFEFIVQIEVSYGQVIFPESTGGERQTDNGRVPVPFGSWGIDTGWTTAPLSGVDYRGQAFTTKVGEPLNVQANVAVFTLTRSQLVGNYSVAAPSINAQAVNVAGFMIPKHCGIMAQNAVVNTDSETAGNAPYILVTQVTYIPKYIGLTGMDASSVVNWGGEILGWQDIGSFDVIVLHQGYREKVNNTIRRVGYCDSVSGARTISPTLSVLDGNGVAVKPDSNGVVKPYYLVYQIYPSSVWTI